MNHILKVLTLIGCLAMSQAAHAQFFQNFHQSIDIPASPMVVGASSTSNITTTAVTVRQGSGIAILPLFAGTNAGTAVLTLHFEVSADGTNFTTTTPLKALAAQNGTTGVLSYTNFPPDLLNNVRAIRLAKVQNAHTAQLFLTNVVVSHSNR